MATQPQTTTYPKFDTHVHALGPKADFIPVLDALGFTTVLNLSYSGFRDPAELQAYEDALRQDIDKYPERFRFAPAFSVTHFQEPNYVSDVIAKLQRDVDQYHPVAVKIWKDLGMMLKDSGDHYVFCDDPRFTPIYDFIVSKGLAIYMHIADPLAGWLPLDTPSPHANYFRNHPEFHWYNKPGKPSHEEILGHRDALVARYPKTVFVAAHLASLEHDLAQVGEFLDTFPNARVDTAARIRDLTLMPNDVVKAFFIKYQDRVLYGTDWDVEADAFSGDADAKAKRAAAFIDGHRKNFAYFEQTLSLPPEVLHKFYYANAAALFAITR